MTEQKTRIAVFVSGGGTNLQALLDSQRNGVLKSGEIVLVVSSNPTAKAIERAKTANVKSVVADKNTYPTLQERESAIVDILGEENIDLIVLAGYLSILSENFTRAYSGRIINVHPSLIPSFCGKGYYGLKVHESVLKRGVKVTGATVHFVNEIPDGGEIIEQKTVRVKKTDTPLSLQKRVMEQAEWIILPRAVEKVSAQLIKTKNRKEK